MVQLVEFVISGVFYALVEKDMNALSALIIGTLITRPVDNVILTASCATGVTTKTVPNAKKDIS